MSEKRTRQPVGSLKISEDVIATIASVAAMEVDGVAALALPPTQMGKLFLRRLSRQPIHVELGDDVVDINLSVELKFGAKITEVCTAVQNAVKDNVQTMTGMAVGKVNVLVSGIVFHGEPEPQQD